MRMGEGEGEGEGGWGDGEMGRGDGVRCYDWTLLYNKTADS